MVGKWLRSDLLRLGALIAVVALLIAPSGTVWGDGPVVASPIPSNGAVVPVQPTVPALANPLEFEENVGQLPAAARFEVRTGSATVFLADDTIWVTMLTKPTASTLKGHPKLPGAGSTIAPTLTPTTKSATAIARVNVALRFAGSSPHPTLQPIGRLAARVSSFVGKDQSHWKSDLPVWSGVRYVDLYPGVDLEITGDGGYLAWRLVDHNPPSVSEASSLARIGLTVTGADQVQIDGTSLRIGTALGKFRLPLLSVLNASPTARPTSQVGSSPTAPTALVVADLGAQAGVRTFSVSGPFSNDTRNLSPMSDQAVPNTSLDQVYSTYLGGSTFDDATGVALDGLGDVYIVGYTQSADFPTTAGAFQKTMNSQAFQLVFVSELRPSGLKTSDLVASTFLGGTGPSGDVGFGIALDGNQNVYVVGNTSSADFPVTAGAFQTSFGAPLDATEGFLTILNKNLTSPLIYSTFLGGTTNAQVTAVALAESGNTTSVYLTGQTQDIDFPVTAGAYQPACGSSPCNSNAFVTVFNSTGSGAYALTYSTYLGGSSFTSANAIAVNAAGSAYITGITEDITYPTTSNAFQTACLVGQFYCQSSFLTVIAPNGQGKSDLQYSTYLGGSDGTWGFGVVVDASGDAYVAGETYSNDFPTTANAFEPACPVAGSAICDSPWVSKIAPLGGKQSDLAYSTFLNGNTNVNGSGQDAAFAIALDAADDIFVTGETETIDFPTTAGAFQTTCPGTRTTPTNCDSPFLIKLDPTGHIVKYGAYLGGGATTQPYGNEGTGLAVDSTGNAYVVGNTYSLSFPTTHNAYKTSAPAAVPNGTTFFTEINPAAAAVIPSTMTPIPSQCPVTTAIANGGFENGLNCWTILASNPAPATTTAVVHGGANSVILGFPSTTSTSEPTGDSAIIQFVTVPTGSPVLSYWYYPISVDTLPYDYQDAYVTNSSGMEILVPVMHVCSGDGTWEQVTVDLSAYVGQTVGIEFLDHEDGAGDPTGMYVDDVTFGAAVTPTNTPTSTATPSSTPTGSASTPTSTSTATVTVTSTGTGTPTGTSTPSSTPTVTDTPTNTIVTPTSTPTSTNSPTGTASPPTGTPTISATPTNTPVPPTNSPISTDTPTASETPTVSATSAVPNSPTNSPVPRTATDTPIVANSPTGTATPTSTATPSETRTSSMSPRVYLPFVPSDASPSD